MYQPLFQPQPLHTLLNIIVYYVPRLDALLHGAPNPTIRFALALVSGFKGSSGGFAHGAFGTGEELIH